MKKKHKEPLFVQGQMDIQFFILVIVLLVFGLMMLFSASYVRAFEEEGNSYYYILKQAKFALLGLAGMYAASRFNYRLFHYFAYLIWFVSLILLAITYVMPIRNGARRWIFIGSFSFQPSELAKFAIVILFAHLISLNYSRMKQWKVGTVPFLVILGVTCLLVIMQPHVSGTILLITIGGVMMFIGGTNLKHLFGLAGVGVAGITVTIFALPDIFAHAIVRLSYWLDPWLDPLGKGFQSIQSLLAIGSGGLMGVGLGESRQKYMYLPEVQNDFVFSVVCEELGFVGAALIVILFALLIWRGFVIAMRARDRFGAMIVVGLTTQVGIQALLNIAVVTNTVPNTGISLPFFSYGGTALVIMLCQMGVILSVSRQTNYTKQ